MTTTARRRSATESDDAGSLLARARSGADAPADSVLREAIPKVSVANRVSVQVPLAIEPAGVCEVFGVEDAHLAMGLLRQLLGFMHADPNKAMDAATINEALALVAGVNPSGPVEAMTASMLVGAYRAAADSLRRASHPDQTPAGRALYQSLAFKAMRTFAQLVETLHVGRGKAVKQEINVTHAHVTVEAGARNAGQHHKCREGRG